jgi:spore germination protein YaaH
MLYICSLCQLLLITIIISGCFMRSTSLPEPALLERIATLPVAAPNMPDPLQAPPPTLAEELLSGATNLTAATFTLPITMTKTQLAIELYTTPELLDTFTQGLPDPVPQGYIVVVPRRYVAADGETLTTIAQDLGVPLDFLDAVNPELPLDVPLAADTTVQLPRVYTLHSESALAAVAAELNTTVEALVAVNPGITADQRLQPGQQLLIPLPP